MYDLADFKALTVDNVRLQLSENSSAAMSELLSRFTARYPELMAFQASLISQQPQIRLDCVETLKDWSKGWQARESSPMHVQPS
ncbi:hypothetical protein FKP32DRAFT_1588899 [Trametes sanguinea]|nr:hypothetical protein FKP32DRAFT_1588899 [Trametes sanguinea]